uniref:Uncharacterized protein n=1 Tax=Arundo donax TaxID=35708 RepID=A0A0A9E861_ARUDO
MLPLQKETSFGHSSKNCHPFLSQQLNYPKRDMFMPLQTPS